jgi:hypothetical protein
MIIVILVWIIFIIIKKEVKNSEKNMDEKYFLVRQSKIILWMGVICALFFFYLIILTIIFPDDTVEWWVYLAFTMFAISGILVTLHCIKWELKIENDKIIYTPFFGEKKIFPISSIKKVKSKNRQQIKVYDEKGKLFSVESNCRGYNVLISRLKSEHIPFEN